MKVNEIFWSIQGEGETVGRPKLFIRLSGCTLACSFCDTKYHVNNHEMTSKEIDLLRKHKNWVITGGEPLLYQKEILELIDTYKPCFVEIETNGTLVPRASLKDKISQFNISPKEPRFQPRDKKNKCEPVILGSNVDYRIVKFVYADEKSAPFIRRVINRYNLCPAEVWVMPEGATRKEQLANSKEVWNYCLKNGFNFSPRLHVDVWDAKRGV